MLSLKTMESFSTYISNDKVIDCETKPAGRFGWIVDRMTDILHTETFFQHTVQYPGNHLPVEAFVRSDTMTGYVCKSKGYCGILGIRSTLRTVINRFVDDARTIRPSVQYVSVLLGKDK